MYGTVKHTPPTFSGHKLGRKVELINGQYMHESGSQLDLHKLITNHQDSINLIPVHTNNMRASGLTHGSLAVIDRAAVPEVGKVVCVRYNGDLILRRLEKINGAFCLVSDDPREGVLHVEGAEVERLGTVIWSLYKL